MSDPAIEWERFERLKEWGGDGLAQQLVEMFEQQTPERIRAIRHGSRPEGREEAVRAAHSLRSTALNLGAVRLAGHAEDAEKALKSGEVSGLEALVAALETEFARALLELVGPPTVAGASEKDRRVKPRIAVVEDNPDNRLLIQALLGDRYEISEYENGKEALAGIAGDPPEVVLLDISLPEMDGTEVLAYLRQIPDLTELPVVALTAHAMAGDRERFIGLGFDDYLTKPIVDEDALIEAIERWRKPAS
ncbi:MAG: response regulator [Gemmatimonadota bacterium]